MLQSSKVKSRRKHEKKYSEDPIEEGIPEAPQLSDFQFNHNITGTQADELPSSTSVTENDQDESISNTDKLLNSLSTYENVLCNDVQSEEIDLSHNEVLYIDKLKTSKTSKTSFPAEVFEGDAQATNNITILTNPESTNENCLAYSSLTMTVQAQFKEPSAPTEEKICTNFDVIDNLKADTEDSDIRNYSFTFFIEDASLQKCNKLLSEFYYNPELEESHSYVNELKSWNEFNSKFIQNHYFYKLLMEYLQSKICLKKSQEKIEYLCKKKKNCVDNIWSVWENEKVYDKKYCNDKNPIVFVQKITEAQFNNDIHKEFIQLLNDIRLLTFNKFTTNSFMCSLLKLKIEYYIQSLLTSCPEFTNLDSEMPITINSKVQNIHLQQCISDIKMAISILFIFQRKQSFEIDSSFIEEGRQWISDLVAILIRIGNWKDHIFLLSCLMRCSGMGHWAAQFVQLAHPEMFEDPFRSTKINHILSVMNVLLSPIESNQEYLNQHDSEIINDKNSWMIVDSDGELEADGSQKFVSLKENDLVSILNQIPFARFFEAIFNPHSQQKTNNSITLDLLLKIISLSSDFINILMNGLKLYNTEKYKQFTKRLGRLICHVVLYTTELITSFRPETVDIKMIVLKEYDDFFLRSTKFIYSAKKHGTWQFLASMPFNIVSSNIILKLYAILQLNDNQDEHILNINFSEFEEKFIQLGEEEQVYLLTTFANMAVARDTTEIQFMKNVVLQLYFIGFVSPQTRDILCKTVGHLLSSVCYSHSFLISELIKIQNNNINENHERLVITYLWLNLPIKMWIPSRIDLEILSQWLMEPLNSVRWDLAKIVLQSLDYGISDGQLFLSQEIHRIIALILLQLSIKFPNETDQGFLKNVSNLVRSQSDEQTVNDWIWSILMKLKLHLLDKTEASFSNYLQCLETYLPSIPELEHNIILYQSVQKKSSVACFIALMTTTHGHSVPIIFDKGFELIDILFKDKKYDEGIACLEFTIFLLLECYDSLCECEKFISLLSHLVVLDNSYVQMAKNFIFSNFPGAILQNLRNMIQNQLNHCRMLNYSNFSNCVKLWFLSLIKIESWTQQPGVLYLLDQLIKNCMLDSLLYNYVTMIMKTHLENISSPSPTKNSLFSLVSWTNIKDPPTLLQKSLYNNFSWFSYTVISMEFEIYEKKNFLWMELLKELHASAGKKACIDASLNKVCNFLGISCRSSSSLAIYKWSHQILNTDYTHSLVPLLWQKFFSLYLYRGDGLNNHGSMGEKFFEGITNQRIFKQLKQRLSDTIEYFKNLYYQEEEKEFSYYSNCYKLFQTYSLWINDSSLHQLPLNVYLLPSEYNPELLQMMINGIDFQPINLLEYQYIEEELKNCAFKWLSLKNRITKEKNTIVIDSEIEKNPLDKMKRRFNSYETPVPPPPIRITKNIFPVIIMDILINSKETISFLKPSINYLMKYKEEFHASANKLTHLVENMEELCQHLYRKVEIQKILKDYCSGVKKIVHDKTTLYPCSGPAVINLRYEEYVINENVEQKIGQCLEEFQEITQKNVFSMPDYLISAALIVDSVVEKLIKEFHVIAIRSDSCELIDKLKQCGVNLFFMFIGSPYEKVAECPPLKNIFDKYIRALGKTFIKGNASENDRLLHLIISNKDLGQNLVKYFIPNVSKIDDFIKQYSKCVECVHQKQVSTLRKFNLVQFLVENKPKFTIRSSLITAIGQGLITAGRCTDNEDLIMVLNKHLELLLTYDFPEHYGEILNLILELTQKQKLFPSTWCTFLNTVSFARNSEEEKEVFCSRMVVKKLKFHIDKQTLHQAINFNTVKGTINILASHFKKERLKAGNFGLYDKYRDFIEPLFTFFGMLSHSFLIKLLELESESLSEKISQELWSTLYDLYSPWLIPYQRSETYDASYDSDTFVTLPWSSTDLPNVSFSLSMFVEFLRFIIDTPPGFKNFFNQLWFFYANNFAHVYVKDCVLNPVHEYFLRLPWKMFFPNIHDIEIMLKIVERFLPACHCFLGNVFVNINWTQIVAYYRTLNQNEVRTKFHSGLFHLLVKLSLEPTLKENDRLTDLLNEACDFDWHLLDSSTYDTVLNWFIMSCDPRIILMDDKLKYYERDSKIFRLLKISAGFLPDIKLFHSTTTAKRVMFIRACIKWLILSNQRFKTKESPLFKNALFRVLDDIDSLLILVTEAQQNINETTTLIREFLSILRESELSVLVTDLLSNWLSKRHSQAIIQGLLRAAGHVIDNVNAFGNVMEFSLEIYFDSSGEDWSEITSIVAPFSKTSASLEQILFDNKCYLTLYTTFLVRVSKDLDSKCSRLMITELLYFLTDIKLSTAAEPKVILLLGYCLKLIAEEMKNDRKSALSLLIRFCDIIKGFVDNQKMSFLLSVAMKRFYPSDRFKLVCLIACSGAAIFVKNNFPDHFEKFNDNILQDLENADKNKVYQNINQYAFQAKTVIQHIKTLEEVVTCIKDMSFKLFNRIYLK